jgi:hypothetical protein
VNVLSNISYQIARSCTQGRRAIFLVEEGTSLERQAAATNARRQLITQPLQRLDALI